MSNLWYKVKHDELFIELITCAPSGIATAATWLFGSAAIILSLGILW